MNNLDNPNRIAGINNTLGNLLHRTATINKVANVGSLLEKVASYTAAVNNTVQKNFITGNLGISPLIDNRYRLEKIANAVANPYSAFKAHKSFINVIIGSNNSALLNSNQVFVAQAKYMTPNKFAHFAANTQIDGAILNQSSYYTARSLQQDINLSTTAYERFRRDESVLKKQILDQLDDIYRAVKSLNFFTTGSKTWGTSFAIPNFTRLLAAVYSPDGRRAKERFEKHIEDILANARKKRLYYSLGGDDKRFIFPAIFEYIRQNDKYNQRCSFVLASESSSSWLKTWHDRVLANFMDAFPAVHTLLKNTIDNLFSKIKRDLRNIIRKLHRQLRTLLKIDIRYLLRTIIRSLRVDTFDGKDDNNAFAFQANQNETLIIHLKNHLKWLTRRYSSGWWRLPSPI